MNIFKKKPKTPYERRAEAQKTIRKTGKKRDALGESKYSPFHSQKWKDYTGIMADAYSDIELAEEEIKLSAAAPKSDTRTKTTTVKIEPKIDVSNTKQQGIQITESFNGNKGKNKTTPNPKSNKKSKLKNIAITVCLFLLLLLVILIWSGIASCTNK